MTKEKITKSTTIEEIVEENPTAVTYLMQQGVRCIRCGDPQWGTLEEAAKDKGFSEEDINRFVKEINELD
ncbi:MAG: DUF1858 domain-containing protein [Bacteroidota bacterium]